MFNPCSGYVTSAVGNQLLTKNGTFWKNLVLENYNTLNRTVCTPRAHQTLKTQRVCLYGMGQHLYIDKYQNLVRCMFLFERRVKELRVLLDDMMGFLVLSPFCLLLLWLKPARQGDDSLFCSFAFIFFLIQYRFCFGFSDSTSIILYL